ncbi:flagellar hook-length control protein FliK [uncultured Roseovarius sp.]|uniref:flagellar hook-length control protein FliK n=2 Tax=Roseovarius TaxID=74030 RepID=UPI0025EB0836|nr:flagellar hook-length control protein FliK [uncultured Roseovarius sp.]
MLMPTIANGPGQGPPIARQGAPDTRAGKAPQRDTKDAFGALFRKGDTPGQGGLLPRTTDAGTSDETSDGAVIDTTAEIAEPAEENTQDFDARQDDAILLQAEPPLLEPAAEAPITPTEPEQENPQLALIPVTDQITVPKETTQAGADARVVTQQDLRAGQNRHPAETQGTQEGPGQGATRAAENMPADPVKALPLTASATAVAARATRGGNPDGPTGFKPDMATAIAGSENGDAPLVFEARVTAGNTPASAIPTQALWQRPELPQHIAMQIAAAAQRGEGNRPIDLILSPAELGPLRLSLSSLDGVMSVTVTAERPETLDLMRRHIDTLAQEFLNIGYGKAEFSFGGGQSGETGQDPADASILRTGETSTQDPVADTPNLHHRPILITDRLDIRL